MTALVAFLDRVVADDGVERRGEVVRAVLRRPADALARIAAPPAPAVVGGAPDDVAADIRRAERGLHEAGEVGVGKPARQHPARGRLREAGADADRDALDAVLVPVEPAHQLAIGLGQAVVGVGPQLAVVVQRRRALVEADGVVGGGEDDARLVQPRRLEDVEQAADVGAEHLFEGALRGDAAEMQDGAAALCELGDRRAVAQVRRLEARARRQRAREGLDVGEHQLPAGFGEPLGEHAAERARGPGQQDRPRDGAHAGTGPMVSSRCIRRGRSP